MEQLYANPLAAFMQGRQMASAIQEERNQNALRDLYRTQGEGIANGDPAAINALAQLDPAAAMQVRQQGIQNARADRAEARADRGMQMDEERLGLAREAARVEAERYLAAGRAAELEKEIEQTRGTLEMLGSALGRGDTATFDQIKGTLGEDFADMTPENYASYAAAAGASLEGMYEAMDAANPRTSDRYKVVGGSLFDLGAEGGPKEVAQGSQPTETIYGPEGNVIVQRGGPAVPKLNVEEGKNTGFYIRTQDAHDTITNLEGQGGNWWQQQAEKMPLGLGNYGRTPEFQKFDQARRDFVNAILRRESGAVISDEEFDNANKQYFPVPGDSPEVIAQKRRNRENAIEGLQISSGGGADYVDSTRKPAEDGGRDFSGMTSEDMNKINIDDLSDAEVTRMLQRYKEIGE